MPRPRPGSWDDLTDNESRPHTLDWRAPLKGATISSIDWASRPVGIVFTGSVVLGGKTTITITPPTTANSKKYLIHAKIVTSLGNTLETTPPIQLTVQPGGRY